MNVLVTNIKKLPLCRIVCLLCLFNMHALNAAWRSSGGPEGGNISSIIAIDSILIAGAKPGGIYRSSDRGESWQFVGTGTRARSITNIDTLGSILIASAQGGGLEQYALSFSYDKGATWSENEHSWPFMGINALTVHKNSIFVKVQQGVLFRSDDTAKTWISLEKNVPSGLFLNVGEFVSKKDTLIAYTSGGIMLTNNNGNSWSDITGNLHDDLPVTAIAINDTILLAGTLNALYQFDSDKKTWSAIKSFPQAHISSINCNFSYWHIGFYQGNVRIYNAVTRSWLNSNDDNEFKYQPINCFCRLNNKIFVGTSAGVFYSEELNKWARKSEGIFCQDVSDFASAKDRLFTTALGAGVFVNEATTYWKHVGNSSLPNNYDKCISFLTAKPVVGTIPTLNDSGGIYILTESSQSMYWNYLPAYQNKSCTTCIYYIRDLETCANTLFIGGSGGFFRSSDSGKTVNKVPGSDKIIDVNCLYNDSFSNTLFIGGNQGVFKYNTLTNALSDQLLGHLTYAISGNEKSLFAGAWRQGVLRSDNHGETWTKTSLQLPSIVPVVALACIDDSIFAGTTGLGVFFSIDNGDNWQELNDGLTCPLVNALHIHGGKLYAGTNGGSVFEMPLTKSNSIRTNFKQFEAPILNIETVINSVKISMNSINRRRYDIAIIDILGRTICNEIVRNNQTLFIPLPNTAKTYIVQVKGYGVDIKKIITSIK